MQVLAFDFTAATVLFSLFLGKGGEGVRTNLKDKLCVVK
jgi:hypothetical protein